MTNLSMYIFRAGMCDRQIEQQFKVAFDKSVKNNDPGWGEVVIAAGMHGVMTPHKGDLNMYWWWSGSEDEDWLEYYMNHVTVKPEIILCTSLKMFDHAKKRGYRSIYLPVATGNEFFPLDLQRSGTGYCGTPGHKSTEQGRCIIEPAPGFEWLFICVGGRPELNRWYNSKSVCLGMTADTTQKWGIVPTRTYEVLAGANPYVTYKHWAMNDTLGFEYPYQSSSPEETVAMIEDLTNNDHDDEFAKFAEIIRKEHTWDKRMEMLRDGL